MKVKTKTMEELRKLFSEEDWEEHLKEVWEPLADKFYQGERLLEGGFAGGIRTEDCIFTKEEFYEVEE